MNHKNLWTITPHINCRFFREICDIYDIIGYYFSMKDVSKYAHGFFSYNDQQIVQRNLNKFFELFLKFISFVVFSVRENFLNYQKASGQQNKGRKKRRDSFQDEGEQTNGVVIQEVLEEDPNMESMERFNELQTDVLDAMPIIMDYQKYLQCFDLFIEPVFHVKKGPNEDAMVKHDMKIQDQQNINKKDYYFGQLIDKIRRKEVLTEEEIGTYIRETAPMMKVDDIIGYHFYFIIYNEAKTNISPTVYKSFFDTNSLWSQFLENMKLEFISSIFVKEKTNNKRGYNGKSKDKEKRSLQQLIDKKKSSLLRNILIWNKSYCLFFEDASGGDSNGTTEEETFINNESMKLKNLFSLKSSMKRRFVLFASKNHNYAQSPYFFKYLYKKEYYGSESLTFPYPTWVYRWNMMENPQKIMEKIFLHFQIDIIKDILLMIQLKNKDNEMTTFHQTEEYNNDEDEVYNNEDTRVAIVEKNLQTVNEARRVQKKQAATKQLLSYLFSTLKNINNVLQIKKSCIKAYNSIFTEIREQFGGFIDALESIISICQRAHICELTPEKKQLLLEDIKNGCKTTEPVERMNLEIIMLWLSTKNPFWCYKMIKVINQENIYRKYVLEAKGWKLNTSVSETAILNFIEKEQTKDKIRTLFSINKIDKSLSLFSTYECRILLELEECHINDAHNIISILLKDRCDASRYDFENVHQNAYLHSRIGATSKSIVLLFISGSSIESTYRVLSYETTRSHAEDTPKNNNGMIFLYDELEKSMINNGKDSTQLHVFKERTSLNRVNFQRLVIDPETQERRSVFTEKDEISVNICCSNNMPSDPALLRRFMFISLGVSGKNTRSIADTWLNERITPNDNAKTLLFARQKHIQAIVAEIEWLIYQRVLHEPSSHVSYVLLLHVRHELKKLQIDVSINDIQRIYYTARFNCILNAILHLYLRQKAPLTLPIQRESLYLIDRMLFVTLEHILSAIGQKYFLLINPTEYIIKKAFVEIILSYVGNGSNCFKPFIRQDPSSFSMPFMKHANQNVEYDYSTIKYDMTQGPRKNESFFIKLANAIYIKLQHYQLNQAIPEEKTILTYIQKWKSSMILSPIYKANVFANEYKELITDPASLDEQTRKFLQNKLYPDKDMESRAYLVETEYGFDISTHFILACKNLQEPIEILKQTIKNILETKKGQPKKKYIFSSPKGIPYGRDFIEIMPNPDKQKTFFRIPKLSHQKFMAAVTMQKLFSQDETIFNSLFEKDQSQSFDTITTDLDSYGLFKRNELLRIDENPINEKLIQTLFRQTNDYYIHQPNMVHNYFLNKHIDEIVNTKMDIYDLANRKRIVKRLDKYYKKCVARYDTNRHPGLYDTNQTLIQKSKFELMYDEKSNPPFGLKADGNFIYEDDELFKLKYYQVGIDPITKLNKYHWDCVNIKSHNFYKVNYTEKELNVIRKWREKKIIEKEDVEVWSFLRRAFEYNVRYYKILCFHPDVLDDLINSTIAKGTQKDIYQKIVETHTNEMNMQDIWEKLYQHPETTNETNTKQGNIPSSLVWSSGNSMEILQNLTLDVNSIGTGQIKYYMK